MAFLWALLSFSLAFAAFTRADGTFYRLRAKYADGTQLDFAELKGKVVIIVNVASECGFTHLTYEGLYYLAEDIQRDYPDRLQILAFPCNQFGAQEPQSAPEVARWARSKYNVKFPIMEKVDVYGENTHEVYRWLAEQSHSTPTWNFWKYVVNQSGELLARYPHDYTVRDMTEDIISILKTGKIASASRTGKHNEL